VLASHHVDVRTGCSTALLLNHLHRTTTGPGGGRAIYPERGTPAAAKACNLLCLPRIMSTRPAQLQGPPTAPHGRLFTRGAYGPSGALFLMGEVPLYQIPSECHVRLFARGAYSALFSFMQRGGGRSGNRHTGTLLMGNSPFLKDHHRALGTVLLQGGCSPVVHAGGQCPSEKTAHDSDEGERWRERAREREITRGEGGCDQAFCRVLDLSVERRARGGEG